jgi:AraC-like DNA-binding protein
MEIERNEAPQARFPEQVLKLIKQNFFSTAIDQATVASLLALSPKTLQRRLRDFGTSFRDIKQQARMELAEHLLRDSELPIGNISEMLDYSEQSVFTRFFKTRHGMSPNAWRAQMRDSAARRNLS